MTAIEPRSRPAARFALGWCHRYTRDLAPTVADDRLAELTSDVWEQTHDPDTRAHGPALVWRTLRSIPADLAWRRRALAGDPSHLPPLHLRWERSGLLAVVLLEGAALVVVTCAVLVRAALGGGAGTLGPGVLGVLATLVLGAVLAVVGLRLALTPRTRWIAPLLIGASSSVLLRVGVPAVVQISVTASTVYLNSRFTRSSFGWPEVELAALALGAVFHLAVAAAWLPRRRPRGAAR